ncbi:F5/8 type C domain-containing protein [Lamellibrachia satsuma]|nr:F5/8 type C domain-containing protein [Lamellibrachia satsuma]
MPEESLASEGATVVLATSCDENYPPENIIDGKTDTFWVSTGLFPQEFIISFASTKSINTLQLDCYNVKCLEIERSTENEPLDFKPLLTEKELAVTDNQLQTAEMPVGSVSAQHLKFTISSGHDHFVSVHRLLIDG